MRYVYTVHIPFIQHRGEGVSNSAFYILSEIMFNVRSSYTFLLSRKSVIFFLKMTDALTAKLKDVSITYIEIKV